MLENKLDEYFEVFGKNYPLMRTGSKSESEIIAEIDACIASKTEAKPPEYKEVCYY